MKKSDPSDYSFNPDDLHIPVDKLKGRYDSQTWATFEQWRGKTPVRGNDSLTGWDWIGEKNLAETPRNPLILSYDKSHATNADKASLQEGKAMQISALSKGLSASDIIARAVRLAISAEQPLWDLGATVQDEYSVKATASRIDAEENKLLAWAKENNRFLDPQEVAAFEKQAGASGGGSEHDVWKINAPDGVTIIRRTIKDSYGFAHSSPFQYLRRMGDVSMLVANAPIEFLGMSQKANGNGVIWTVQPYIEGDHPTLSQLSKYLFSHGWIELKSQHGHLVFLNKATGITMHDAHSGNFIQTADGDIIPIDVFFEGLDS